MIIHCSFKNGLKERKKKKRKKFFLEEDIDLLWNWEYKRDCTNAQFKNNFSYLGSSSTRFEREFWYRKCVYKIFFCVLNVMWSTNWAIWLSASGFSIEKPIRLSRLAKPISAHGPLLLAMAHGPRVWTPANRVYTLLTPWRSPQRSHPQGVSAWGWSGALKSRDRPSMAVLWQGGGPVLSRLSSLATLEA